MDPNLAAILTTVALTLIALVATLLGYQRGRGPKPVVAGIGVALIPIGLWITGVMGLIVNGFASIARWLRATQMDLQHWVGVAVAGLGVLLVLASLAISSRSKDEARAVREARRQPSVGAAPQGRSTELSPAGRAGGASAPATQPAPTQRKAAAPVDDEDAEIEALLKKRGIN